MEVSFILVPKSVYPLSLGPLVPWLKDPHHPILLVSTLLPMLSPYSPCYPQIARQGHKDMQTHVTA